VGGGTDRLGDLLQRVAQGSQVHVTVDAAELLTGLDHPGGAPAQRHLPVAPALDVARVITTIEIIDSTALVDLKVLARVGSSPSYRPRRERRQGSMARKLTNWMR